MRLIDADALIESLGIEDEDIVFRGMLEDAPTVDLPDALRAAGWKEDGWVSVKDRLPDESGPYLVKLENVFVTHLAMNVHYWNAKDGYWRGSEAHSRIIGISHWMSLPEPPKEDDDA